MGCKSVEKGKLQKKPDNRYLNNEQVSACIKCCGVFLLPDMLPKKFLF